jgi:hypothetical protein
MKIYEIWTSDPSHWVQDRSKKNSLNHGNPMKSSSLPTDRQIDRQTDRRTDEVRTIAYSRKYAKNEDSSFRN